MPPVEQTVLPLYSVMSDLKTPSFLPFVPAFLTYQMSHRFLLFDPPPQAGVSSFKIHCRVIFLVGTSPYAAPTPQ